MTLTARDNWIDRARAEKIETVRRDRGIEAGRARLFALDDGHLARVHIFINRLPSMHRSNWAGNRASNAVPFAWFVWERGHSGDAKLNRISWNRGAS